MHVVIVGAGPGGLATALNVAGQGHTVTVVEKDAIPGGRMKGLTFGERGEYQVDTGPSIMQLPQLFESIFTRAGKRMADYVKLIPLDTNTRVHFWDGTHLDTSSDPARMAREIERFGADKPAALAKWMSVEREKYGIAYEKFMATPADSLAYYNPFRLLPAAKYAPWQNLHSQLMSAFGDERITYALSYPSKYLGLHPTTCSSVFSVIPYIELAFGVWHVEGGFRALARGMMRCAQELGATFRMSSPVERVRVDEAGKAVGVELKSGEFIGADAVIVNADIAHAATNLIDAKWLEGSRLSKPSLEKAKYSCSTFMAYYGLDISYRDLPHHLIHLSENTRRTDRAFLEDREIDLENPPFYVCNPQSTEATGAPPGHSTLYVLVPTPNTSRGVDWKRTEAVMKERIPQWLEKVGIRNARQHIRAERYFTAETWRDDFNVFRGAVFNLSHTWLQLGPLRPKVRNPSVKGLYFVGGGTHPGSGLLTILESANIAANFIEQASGKSGLPDWPHVVPVGTQVQSRVGA